MHGLPGTVRLPSTRLAEWLAPGKGTKHTAHLSLCPCGVPRNLSVLDLGLDKMQGPLGIVHFQSTMMPEQCGPGKYMLPWAVANPVWSIHCEHSPQVPAVFVCSVPPSPQHN